MNLKNIIGNLLLHHNCVIVPEFGGFFAKITPSILDTKKGIVYPPKKSIIFNNQLINNDGLLVNEFAKINNISYDVSFNEIKKIVSEWKIDLKNGKQIFIDRVGFLFYDDSNKKILFEQDKYFNLLLSSFGLINVHFISEIEKNNYNLKFDVNDLRNQTFIKNKKSNELGKKINILFRYASIFLIFLIVFYSIWIPMKTNVLESKIISFQDFNPFYKQKQANYSQKSVQPLIQLMTADSMYVSLDKQLKSVISNENIYSYNLSDKTYILINIPRDSNNKIENNQINNDDIQNNFQINEITPLKEQDKFYIVGCFSTEDNALKFIKKLETKGLESFIKDSENGLYRVSLKKSKSQDDLNKLIAKAKYLGLKGWISR